MALAESKGGFGSLFICEEKGMYEFKIISRNCFAVYSGKYQELPIGAIIKSSNPNAFGLKAERVTSAPKLEIATPQKAQEPVEVPEEGSEYEEELRAFILEKSGKHAGGRSTIDTLEKRAKKLGWEG